MIQKTEMSFKMIAAKFRNSFHLLNTLHLDALNPVYVPYHPKSLQPLRFWRRSLNEQNLSTICAQFDRMIFTCESCHFIEFHTPLSLSVLPSFPYIRFTCDLNAPAITSVIDKQLILCGPIVYRSTLNTAGQITFQGTELPWGYPCRLLLVGHIRYKKYKNHDLLFSDEVTLAKKGIDSVEGI